MRRIRVAGSAVAVLIIGLLLSGCVGVQPLADPAGAPGEPELPAFGLVSTREAADILEGLQGEPTFVLLDIRTPAEVEAGHIAGAQMLDYYSDTFREELSLLDRNATYLIYCRTGNRTGSAYRIMQELGFESVYDLDGGITQWIAQGFEVCEGALQAEHFCTSGGQTSAN